MVSERVVRFFETKFTFRDIHSIRGGKSTLINLLSQSYKFESLKFIPKSAIQSVEVKSAHKKNMKALLCEISYEYEVWEEKLTGERKVGNGTLKKPEGILFILSVDIPAK